MGQPDNGIVESYTMVIAMSQALADPFDLLRKKKLRIECGSTLGNQICMARSICLEDDRLDI